VNVAACENIFRGAGDMGRIMAHDTAYKGYISPLHELHG
jgi:hypothetical protein